MCVLTSRTTHFHYLENPAVGHCVRVAGGTSLGPGRGGLEMRLKSKGGEPLMIEGGLAGRGFGGETKEK